MFIQRPLVNIKGHYWLHNHFQQHRITYYVAQNPEFVGQIHVISTISHIKITPDAKLLTRMNESYLLQAQAFVGSNIEPDADIIWESSNPEQVHVNSRGIPKREKLSTLLRNFHKTTPTAALLTHNLQRYGTGICGLTPACFA